MKKHYIITAALALSLMGGCVEVKVENEGREKSSPSEKKDREEREPKHEDSERGEKEDRDSQAKLRAAAKISESVARHKALEKVPGGKIKEGELEQENGHLQWSFDITVPGAAEITEVNIDAITGEIISVSKESPESEKAEKKEGEKEKE